MYHTGDFNCGLEGCSNPYYENCGKCCTSICKDHLLVTVDFGYDVGICLSCSKKSKMITRCCTCSDFSAEQFCDVCGGGIHARNPECSAQYNGNSCCLNCIRLQEQGYDYEQIQSMELGWKEESKSIKLESSTSGIIFQTNKNQLVVDFSNKVKNHIKTGNISISPHSIIHHNYTLLYLSYTNLSI